MKDRYLHRAKRKNWRELPKEKWWVEGYYAFIDNHHYIYTGNLCNGGLYVVAERFEIDIDALCACTGLKDKNGKMIWENDIVSFLDMYSTENGYSERGCVGKVVWDDETISFQVTNRLSAESYEVLDECLVIGNIFDNPELLEVRE